MFTGIIRGIGKVARITDKKYLRRVEIIAPDNWNFIEGESICVSGICSTVVKNLKNKFEVDYMEETLGITTAKYFQNEEEVNLEKSLKMGDALDGHIVYGHVEGTGKILQVSMSDDQSIIKISISKKFLKYIVFKGSMAIDGVSLTVSKKTPTYFEVSLIPYTLSHTTLGKLKEGDIVNIETDALAKYKSRNLKHAKKTAKN